MARLPVYNAQQGIQPAGAPSIPDQGAVGRALQGAGNALQGVGSQLSDLDQRYAQLQRQRSDTATITSIDTFKQQQLGQRQIDLQNAPANGSNYTPTTMGRYDEDEKKFISSLPADQQEKARQQLAPFRQGYLNAASQEELGLTRNYSTNTAKDWYNSTLNAVNSPNITKEQRDTYLAGLKQRVDGLPGLSAAEKDDIIRGAEKGVALQYVKALAPADPDKVRQLQGYKPQSSGLPANADAHLAALDQKYSLPPGFLARTMQIESGGKDVPNKQGSPAKGYFQFIPSTARRMQVDPHDFASSADGAARLARESADVLRPILGREPTAAELYLAHQQGAGGASKLLANPNASAASIVGTKAVIQNGGTQGMTAGEFANMWINKYNGSKLPSYAQAAVSAPTSSSAPATQPQPAAAATSYAPTTDPVLSRLSPNDWDSLYNEARTQQNQNRAIARANLEPIVQDASAAFMTTGNYNGTLPTQQDFTAAYGAEQGIQRYTQFQQVQDIGRHIDAFKSMTPDQIQADIEAAKPVASGEGFAMAQARYEAMAKAAATTIKMRLDDPAKYVQTVNPGVAAQWQNASTPEGYRVALAGMAAAQTQLGIPAQNQKLLPDDYAQKVVDTIKNQDIPAEQRFAAITNTILRTPDQKQQQVIFQQLVKAGMPEETVGAIEAFSRGDVGDGKFLMTAALTDPAKLPTQIKVGPAQIKAEIQDSYRNQLDAAYGLTLGTPTNIQRAETGTNLMVKAVQLRLAQGDPDVATATKNVMTMMFGKDFRVMDKTPNGRNATVAVPRGTDQDALGSRLDEAMPVLINTLADKVQSAVARGANGNPTAEAGLSVDAFNQVGNIVSEGKWVNYDGGFAFFDPYTNSIVTKANGQPLVVRLEDGPIAAERPPVSQQPSAPSSPVLQQPLAPAPATQPKPPTEKDLKPLEAPIPGTAGVGQKVQSQIQQLRQQAQDPDQVESGGFFSGFFSGDGN